MLTTTKLINRPVSLSLSVKEQALARKNSITTLSLYKLNNSNKQYCLFYNRFGRCSRGESCKLIHDPKRIALCPRSVVFCLIFGILVEDLRPNCVNMKISAWHLQSRKVPIFTCCQRRKDTTLLFLCIWLLQPSELSLFTCLFG